MSRIFAVSYGGGHAALIAPVVKELLRRGHEVTLLGLTTAYPYFKSLGLECIGFRELLEHSNQEAYEIGCRLSRDLISGGPVSEEETIAYLGLNYQDLVARLGAEKAENEYRTKGRHAFLPVSVMELAIDRFQPDLVLATNSPRSEQAAIIAATNRNIPSVCVVDLFALHAVRWIGQAGFATKICVLNQAVKDMFLAHGRADDEIKITGNPAFDHLHDVGVIEAGMRMRLDRGWDDGVVTLLWASQIEPECHPFSSLRGEPDLPRKIEQILRGFVRENPAFRLVIRYHPSEVVEFVEQKGVTLSHRTEDLHTTLHAVDGVVVMTSTVGLEAALLRKPVISVDCSIFSPDSPYSKMGISHGVPTPSDLPAAILSLKKHGQFAGGYRAQNRVSHQMPDMSATRKVLNVIESLLDSNSISGCMET